MAASTRDTQVLIIGAGVVGLSASLFLAQHGVRSIIIERRAGTSEHPRARSVNLRTMELFRHLSIDSAAHEAGKSIASSKGMYSGRSLREVIEPHKRKAESKPFNFAGITKSFSPAQGTFVTQDKLEPVLVETAKQRGVKILFNHEFNDLEQASDSVSTTVKNRSCGVTSTIRSKFVIAADGAKSPICRRLGVKKSGRGAMGHMINILFDADLSAFVKGREFSIVKIRSPEVNGLFTSINNANRWVFHLSYDPAKEQASEFTVERCTELVKLALGMPDTDVKVESLLPWEPAVNVADEMRHGRVFLAGDAAHQMPPWAGQGANSGFADVHNLAWKLAAVLEGRANIDLLDTYNAERQPVGKYAAKASATGTDEMGVTGLNLSKSNVRQGFIMKVPLFAGLGYGYASRSICEESNWPLGGLTWTPLSLGWLFFSLDGRPGRRMPHIWVKQAGRERSTIDAIGTNLTLFTDTAGSNPWREAAATISTELDMQIDIQTIGQDGDLTAEATTWNTAAGIASGGALLVRPDDFVAKRWRRSISNAHVELRQAVLRTLCK